ncbi:signal peptidase I [Pseudodesulfovibrio mercurii]|uniref:Signal peptidase I n=1 Tax=Pseudodesulfovibrio mercurii TaxID=641491 RepID=F0JBU3_9BACT|nr:signal peptidase I [Pseudodesulfovibrio mercurii]EGB14336.1 signal peptidase I [Pseudodesulfovibrio mercurii]
MAETQPLNALREKPRNPWLAMVLSLVAVGLGQVYNGQWRKGVGFYVAEIILALFMILFWADFAAMLLCVSILLGYNLFAAGEAFATARRLSGYTLKPCNRWWVYLLCLAVSLGSGAVFEQIVKGWFFMAYQVPSASMLPTIRVGDHFMVEVLEPGDALERGEIVIFSLPETNGRDFVKRVVGLPGETVEIRERKVFIDGTPLNEPYVFHSKEDFLPLRDTFGPVVLGPDEYFLMGDNREDSYDSRWLGPVRRERITGRAGYIYLPGDLDAPDWADRLGAPLR